MSGNNVQTIPVVDLFAGPGGLGEGFSAYSKNEPEHPFLPVLSIEKEPNAHSTLQLRSFFRQFRHSNRPAPVEYYMHLADEVTRSELFAAYPEEVYAVQREALLIELGGRNREDSPDNVDRCLTGSLDGAKKWVLLGGPPCQAYSGAGRSRILGAEKRRLLNGRDPLTLTTDELEKIKEAAHQNFSEDPRHVLYREYLRIIAKHAPPVFVMENVRGILSSQKNGCRIFPRILLDLRYPYSVAQEYWPSKRFKNFKYRLFSFVTGCEPVTGSEGDFLIRAENYGIPQARHRVIILGLRSDLIPDSNFTIPRLGELKTYAPCSLRDVIGLLPKLRSGVSRGKNTEERWIAELQKAGRSAWLYSVDDDVRDAVHKAIKTATVSPPATIVRGSGMYLGREDLRSWFCDPELLVLPNSDSTRAHMPSDIHRYLFIASFGKVHRRSPTLADFPPDLLPDHSNINRKNLKNVGFTDRFRVQTWHTPSTTITCHISKDGHYFIHPDPSQCRSLTVREAARLQTFPDNYLFCGKQTHQYIQVGNAVPPLLAVQLAAVVYSILEELI